MAMAIDVGIEEAALYYCNGSWHPCLILEKRPTGNYIIWLCDFCCNQHYHRRTLVPWGERSENLRAIGGASST